MATYIVLNTAEILPLGVATSKKAANEIGEATGGEDYDIVEDAADLAKHYKLPEIVRLHNSVVDAETAVLRFKSKKEGAAAAWDAIRKFDFAEGSPEPKEGTPASPGRKKATGNLMETGIISRGPNENSFEGWTRVSEKSLRGKVLSRLVEFMGKKKSVSAKEFYETLPEGESKSKFSATLHHLMRCGQITVQVEKDGDLVDWMTPSELKRQKYEERQAKKAEREAEKAAKAKAKKAKKKATEDSES